MTDCPGINPVSVDVAQKFLKNETLNYSELSQAIHPILGTSFLYLHPCMSQNLIKITPKRYDSFISRKDSRGYSDKKFII